MDIIIGKRGYGKTYSLVKISAEKQIPIMVITLRQKECLLDIAKRNNLKIPEPILVEQSKGERANNILIDNAEDMLAYLLNSSIDTMTIADESNLGDVADKKQVHILDCGTWGIDYTKEKQDVS